MVQITYSRFTALRASIVAAVLVTLCVSTNVGPCFLPLPSLEAAAAQNSREERDTLVSRPQAGQPAGFRVPMMTRAHKRADREPEHQSPGLLPGSVRPVLNDHLFVAELVNPDTTFALPFVPVSAGRAPPLITKN